MYIELFHNVQSVGFDRFNADAQLFTNKAVGVAVGDKSQYLPFTRCQQLRTVPFRVQGGVDGISVESRIDIPFSHGHGLYGGQ